MPSKPELIGPGKSLAGKAGSSAPMLKEAGRAPGSPLSTSKEGLSSPALGEESGSRPSAPAGVSANKASEDNLLQAITLQSNPAHAGGFSGLAGMRQLRQTGSLSALNALAEGEKANIADEDDNRGTYLGEISVVPVRGTHPSNK